MTVAPEAQGGLITKVQDFGWQAPESQFESLVQIQGLDNPVLLLDELMLLLAFGDDGADAPFSELDGRVVGTGNSGSRVWGFKVWHLGIVDITSDTSTYALMISETGERLNSLSLRVFKEWSRKASDKGAGLGLGILPHVTQRCLAKPAKLKFSTQSFASPLQIFWFPMPVIHTKASNLHDQSAPRWDLVHLNGIRLDTGIAGWLGTSETDDAEDTGRLDVHKKPSAMNPATRLRC
ncbi:uncharacterized protein EDB91DRAFT_1079559 [Suillus paluster]|uniref:uncharacterized protein n=1 Tax=Suillus paluster TaxID=48578 RepID=UPI001B861198|nr:uncharacterized protein EDB91DRAFT_1079559 [Suillus paluster]KAG1747860.1 hypothetical protein EDB91DRAFT_1079559 [Suillus paluster]